MKIVGIAIVRNEADILRVNVQHHLALGLDSFLIVDNGSSDDTPEVLRELGSDPRVRWTRDDGPYRQSEITTELAREAVREGAHWVLPIDADEFWWTSGGDLRRLLEESEAGALRAQVLNFVQRRDQVNSSPEALLSMTMRTPLPIGPLERVRERVESGRFAYVEMMYQPKWIFRPTASVEVAMGNHGVTGVDGPSMDTGEIVCLHALLRSRAALEAKVEQGQRVEDLGLDPNQGWHVRRWKRLAESGDLDREWRANSYEGDFLDVYGVPHRVVFDPRLRNLVRPWLTSAAKEKPAKTRPAPDAATDGPADEVAGLLETVHEQMSVHVVEQAASEVLRQTEVGSRDDLIEAMRAELLQKVGERDELIRALQAELHEKVGERDRMIRELQAELHAKVTERDAIIRDLQTRGEGPSAAEPSGAGFGRLGRIEEELSFVRRRLEEELSVERNRLETAESELRKEISRGKDREKRAEERELRAAQLESQLREARLELQRQASVERRLRSAEGELGRLTTERQLLEGELARLRGLADEVARLHPFEVEAARLRPFEQAVAELRDRLESSERARRSAEAASLQASEELVGIHRSRFWKLACLYWNAIASLRRRFAPADARRQAPPAAPPQPPVVAAVSAAPPAAARAEERAVPVRAEAAPAPLPFTPVEASPPASPPAVPPVVEDPRLVLNDRYDVLCLPIIDWHFRFQRPQQLMSQFAEAGHRVFYIAPWLRTSGALYEVRQPRPNVYEVSFRGPERNVYTDVLDDPAREALLEALHALRHDYGLAATATFVQLPFWRPLAAAARERYGWPVVYDCMDHHAGFSTNRPEMLEQEDLLFSAADLVVTSSGQLDDEAARHNPNRLVLRNACDFEHFGGSAIRNPERPVIGYYGAIADWFDSTLVADLAERRPDWDFVLIGDTFTADVERLRKVPNVRFLGEKPYSEIPGWLASFDVAIIPFKRIPLTEATNPVKAYEILAAGKPLVSVPLPEMLLLQPLVRLASTAAEFEEQISAALDDGDWRTVSERRSFASRNTWDSRLAMLAPRVAAAFPRVSIVVVTYNNLDMTQRCVESLYAWTEWPNFEVIVVDNASSDGTPDYLREAERTRPRFEAILNAENTGFSRACNQGLRRASGEFLVLLNNDTVVSRGWLSALVRHLRRDPTIGIIGPVTNAIGNEAMIPVGYDDVGDMPRWAAAFVRDHDGESFDITMLAMFCVAMRRSVYEEVGPLDERFGVGMFEDDDYSLRIRQAGYRVVCAEDSFVHHWMKASFSRLSPVDYQNLFERNRGLFEEKWGTVWKPHSARRTPAGENSGNGNEEGPGNTALETARPAAAVGREIQ